MAMIADLKVLYHLVLKPVRGKNHAERMESFYSGQADAYDDFRRRLLQGREELFRSLPAPESGVWVDLGGGTGSNLEYMADRMDRFDEVCVVDLAESLLEVADQRSQQNHWQQVKTCHADATTFRPDRPVDLVTFSYSLTMIPDWFAAIQNAYEMLRPGGCIGVVDFYVARKHPQQGRDRHGWFTRNFWPMWFGNDNVFPSSDHLPFLSRIFEPESIAEHKAKIPYLPFIRAPYYRFVGTKPRATPS